MTRTLFTTAALALAIAATPASAQLLGGSGGLGGTLGAALVERWVRQAPGPMARSAARVPANCAPNVRSTLAAVAFAPGAAPPVRVAR